MAPNTYEVNFPKEFKSSKSDPTVAVIDLPDSNGNKDRIVSFDDALKEIGEGQSWSSAFRLLLSNIFVSSSKPKFVIRSNILFCACRLWESSDKADVHYSIDIDGRVKRDDGSFISSSSRTMRLQS